MSEEPALALARGAHEGQLDPDGRPHLEHVLRVAEPFAGGARAAALLHDVVEDSDWTLERLAAQGFSDRVVESVDALTRREDEPYEDFVQRAARAGPLAVAVKISDVEDNLRRAREGGWKEKVERYEAALPVLRAEAAGHLTEAVREGDLEGVRALAAVGARDEERVSAVLLARYHDHEELVDALLADAPELDFWEAAALGRGDRVRELLDADPELVNAYAPDGFFPLGLAAFFGHEDVVRLLLHRGADVGQWARNERIRVQPLHAGAANGSVPIVRLLLDAGAPVNEPQPGGFTALDAARQAGNEELVRLLVERGAGSN